MNFIKTNLALLFIFVLALSVSYSQNPAKSDYWNNKTYGNKSLFILSNLLNNNFNAGNPADSITAVADDGYSFERTYYTYNIDGTRSGQVTTGWNGVWLNYGIAENYTYDANGRIQVIYISVNAGGAGPGRSRINYTYDATGNVSSIEEEFYSGIEWSPAWYEFYEYDNSSRLDRYTRLENWDGSQWQVSFSEIYTYNSNNKIVLIDGSVMAGGAHPLLWRESLIYDTAGNIINIVHEDFGNVQWNISWKDSYQYNSNNNPTSILRELWNGSNWNNYSIKTYIYDTGNNFHIGYYEEWNGTNWIQSEGNFNFSDIYSNEYNFDCYNLNIHRSSPTSVKVESGQSLSYTVLDNYPNPFNPSTTIIFSITETVPVSVKIFDALGREVLKLVDEELSIGTYSVKWNADGFTSGVYICLLESGNTMKSQKLMLLK